MNHRLIALFGLGLAGCLFATGEANAQQPVIAPKPTLSPYLNLLRRDAPLGFQYYQRVLPEREFRSSYQQQMQSLDQLKQRLRNLEQPTPVSTNSRLGQTGHPTRFQSYGGYYGGSGNRPGFGRNR